MNKEKIIINSESGKTLEIINEVNPYIWAQIKRESLEFQIKDMLGMIVMSSFAMILSVGIIILMYSTLCLILFGFAFLVSLAAFVIACPKYAKFKKEFNDFEAKYKNNEIEEDIEASIMCCGDYWHGKEERVFLLLDLPNRPVIDFKVVKEDKQIKLEIMMEMENGDVRTRTIDIKPEYNRHIESVQITVNEYAIEVKLPMEYYTL